MKSKLFAVIVCVAVLANVASANLLLNAGFESGDFTSWNTFGSGWRTGIDGDANSGTYGAVNDVLNTDGDEWRGMFQMVDVSAGLSYDASYYARGVAIESSEQFMEIQWLDNLGGIISQDQSSQLTADQGYSIVSLNAMIAPAGAVTASVRGIVHMTSTPVDTDYQTMDDFTFAETIPEPSSLALGGLAIGIIAILRRRSSR